MNIAHFDGFCRNWDRSEFSLSTQGSILTKICIFHILLEVLLIESGHKYHEGICAVIPLMVWYNIAMNKIAAKNKKKTEAEKWAEKFIKKYAPALRELAKK